ncbi:hypothetical protein Cgig2_030534 [Carnegiea gigantea]|uniref:Reverse transcriptase zinc-binding domain-containing protein n=1 Tax=Carnegiea gigantea TaxID=171969 RepID=A0A9Q1GQM5_9CARY|nr:hypothetical protein Cgig2_030534 [Carnegiea gigantea]
MATVHLWTPRDISFTGRARLINCVIFGMYTYYASIFLLPTEVIGKITKICRNFLLEWHRRVQKVGIGIKGLAAWNKATIAKLTWALAKKEKVLWVKWVRERNPQACDWLGDPDCKVAKGYKWRRETQRKVPWIKLIWARPNVSRNAFISWVLIHRRLPTKQRLSKFQPQIDNLCVLCSVQEEKEAHLFYTCNYATTIWNELRQWWRYTSEVHNSSQLLRNLKHSKGARTLKQITSAIMTATFYYIWSARNHMIFKKQQIKAYQIAYLIKD